MKVYCLVVTYNGSKWVDRCVGSLLRSSVPVKIIVVDNASSDNTVQIIREKFTSVDIIEASSNLGFGKANNIGLKVALNNDADYVFFIEPRCLYSS